MHKVHFARVGRFNEPVACGKLLIINVSITNKWHAVTCSSCLEARNATHRPDLYVYKKHLSRHVDGDNSIDKVPTWKQTEQPEQISEILRRENPEELALYEAGLDMVKHIL